jgi:Uma2 family endonuclease
MSETKTHELDQYIINELDISHIITEDDTPVDNLFSERQMRLLVDSLYASWAGPGEGRSFVAMANVGVFFQLHSPPLVPDVLVSVDVTLPPEPWEKRHRSYFVWEYGRPPDVVVEIISNKVGNELGDKLLDYARMGIGYYIVYDPERFASQMPLRIFTRQSLRFAEVTDTWLTQVGLGVALWEGEYEDMPGVWLRWCDRQGAILATGQEALAQSQKQLAQEAQRAEQEAQRAEQEAQRAEQEAQRAAAAEQRAAALAAKLAALGIDPATID